MNIKRFFSALLALCLLLVLSPAAAMAEEPDASSPREETRGLNYGYYLIGRYGWTINDLVESRDQFQQNYGSSVEEYRLQATLEAGQEIKVVLVSGGNQLGPWYPEGDNYVVDAAHAGEKIIYFRPEYNADWAEFGGHMYIADPPTYRVNFRQPANGRLTADKTVAREGETITVTAIPDDGYYPNQIKSEPTVVFTYVNSYTVTFPMPAWDLTVYMWTDKMQPGPGFYFPAGKNVADLTPEERFREEDSAFGEYGFETQLTEGQELEVFRISTDGNWSWMASTNSPTATAAQAGHAKLFLTETEREGYAKIFEVYQYISGVKTLVQEFWMTVKPYRAITVQAAPGGRVSADRSDALEGETVTLTVTPEEGYALDTLTVVDAEGHELPVENNAFTMPDAPVTVTATFKESLVQIDYPLWLGETQVNSLNKNDILGDGTVHYDPATGTLTFDTARPAIQGLHENALLYADGIDLTIEAPQGLELSTDAPNSCGIRMLSGALTVNGDLEIRSTYINVFAGSSEFVLNGDLDLAGGVNGLNCAGIQIHGNVEASSGRNVIYAKDGQLQITGDRIHVVSTDGSNTSMGLYGFQGVTLTGTVEVESIDECVSAPYNTVTINGDATLKSSNRSGITAFDIVINGNLNTETNFHGIDGKTGGGSVSIKGSVNGSCTNKYPSYAVIHGQNISIEGDVTAESKGYGILAENGGVVTMISGTWTLDGGKSAIQAAGGIGIPDTHAIVEPAGGLVSQVGGNYCITQADGSTLATHALIRVPAADYAEVAGISISAKGNIGLNFYLYLPERLEADDGAYVTLDGEKAPISQAAAVELGERSSYRFSLAVPAKEMGRKVTLKVFDGQDRAVQLRRGEEDLTETGLVCAVRDYLDWQIAESDDLKLVNLCKAMRDYGYCAQATFDYEAEDLPAPTGDLASVTAESLLDYEPVLQEGADSGLVHLGSSLLLKSETSLRHYFRLRSGQIGDYSFNLEGQSLTPVQKEDSWYVEIPEITAKMLGNTPTLTVTRGGEQILSLRYGPLSYARCVLLENADETLADQVRALALYAQAAAEYFGE